MKKFLDLESIGIKDYPYINDQDKVLDIFSETVSFENNSYKVSLPWKKDWSELSDIYNVAEKRLNFLIKKLRNGNDLLIQYNNIFREYLNCDIIETITNATKPKDKPVYHLPHRVIFREESATTKTRIIFYGCSHGTGHLSLNDCL